jgi:hypothetical protein
MGDEAIFPVVNGRVYDFASTRFNVAGDFYKGVTAIDYGNALDPGEARGNSPVAMGTSLGQLKPDGSLEMHKASAQALIEALGDGYMGVTFNITSTYRENGMPTITDELVGVRIKKDRDSPKVGNEPPTVKFDLYVQVVLRNGVSPVPTEQ